MFRVLKTHSASKIDDLPVVLDNCSKQPERTTGTSLAAIHPYHPENLISEVMPMHIILNC